MDPGIFLIGGWGCLVLAIGEGRCYHKNPLTTQSVYVSKNRKYSRLPIIRTFKGNKKSLSYREFELSRVKLYGK